MGEKKKELTFEEAISKLEMIVKDLEEETVSLEDSLKLFEEGTRLSELCRHRLNEAEQKIKKLMRDESGKLKLETEE